MKETIDGIEYKILPDTNNTLEHNGLYFRHTDNDYLKLKLVGVDKESLKNIKTIILPKSCKEICSNALFDIRNSIERIIGPNVEKLDDDALKDCEMLEEVYFSALKYIGHRAFSICKRLKYMPNLQSCQEFGVGVFRCCESLCGTLNPDNSVVKDIIIIPKNIHQLESTFSDSNVKDVMFEDGGEYTLTATFYNCLNLNYVNFLDKKISSGLSSKFILGSLAFADSGICKAYLDSKIIVENNIAGVAASGVFSACENLTEFESDINLGENYCSGCINLKTIKLNKGCKKIGNHAFWGTEMEEADLTNVELVGNYAFATSAIKHYTGNPELMVGAFANTYLTEVEINNSIGNECFMGCKHLTKVKINVPIEKIGRLALPISVLSNRPDIDLRKIDLENITQDALPELRKSLNEYNGGYYLGDKNNPYKYLVFHNKDINMADEKKSVIEIHQDCKEIFPCAFGIPETNYDFKEIQLSEGKINLLPDKSPEYTLVIPAGLRFTKHGGLSKVRNYISIKEIIVKSPSQKITLNPLRDEYRDVALTYSNSADIKVDESVKEIENVDALVGKNNLFLPSHMKSVTFGSMPEKMNIYIPKTIDSVDLNLEDDLKGKNYNVCLMIRPNTLKSTVEKFKSALSVKNVTIHIVNRHNIIESCKTEER